VSATRKIGIAPPPRRETVRVDLVENVRVGLVESVRADLAGTGQADRAEIVPTAVARAIAAVRPEPDPVRRAASHRIEIAEVLPAEIATGRERAERTIPSERRMDRSDCGSDV
jgi:hypothetical protein